MCSSSVVTDHFAQRWPQYATPVPWTPGPHQTVPFNPIQRHEFDALKAELTALKDLLKAAKIFDAATGQPDCEQDEKIAMLKRVAEMVGVDLSEVFGK